MRDVEFYDWEWPKRDRNKSQNSKEEGGRDPEVQQTQTGVKNYEIQRLKAQLAGEARGVATKDWWKEWLYGSFEPFSELRRARQENKLIGTVGKERRKAKAGNEGRDTHPTEESKKGKREEHERATQGQTIQVLKPISRRPLKVSNRAIKKTAGQKQWSEEQKQPQREVTSNKQWKLRHCGVWHAANETTPTSFVYWVNRRVC